jgi:two-component system, chemotaxis family, protein-glutamate methylesterase/glutaminase
MTGTARPLPRSLGLVVIGASAGAVEALSVVLPVLSSSYPLPLVIAVHLPANAPSLLPVLFSEKCALGAIEAQDKQPLLPGLAYFAPPDYHLLVEPSRVLSLNADEPVHFSRPSIDVLFESAAASLGPEVLGILLTGANSDGARGLSAIQRAGGYTVVQDPATAQSSAMPVAALRLFQPDRVLTLPQIAALLAQLDNKVTP